MAPSHTSVLVEETLEALAIEPGDTVVDATLGGAGHFVRILAALGGGGVVVGIDADPQAVERARAAYAADRRRERPIAHLVNDNFRNLARILERLGIGAVNAALFDLGWSGYHLASMRGFSFQGDEPLLMTYGLPAEAETAADLVNTLPERELADLLYRYGEERFSRGIARAIVRARAKERITTTGALVAAVLAGVPAWYRKRKLHPATKTFQALRIAVNDEIGALEEGLDSALAALSDGGRLAVISFHSIEDRVVKNILRDAAAAGRGTLSPKKPIVPRRAEVMANRRARSAKLRVFRRSVVPSATAGSGSASYLLSYVR